MKISSLLIGYSMYLLSHIRVPSLNNQLKAPCRSVTLWSRYKLPASQFSLWVLHEKMAGRPTVCCLNWDSGTHTGSLAHDDERLKVKVSGLCLCVSPVHKHAWFDRLCFLYIIENTSHKKTDRQKCNLPPHSRAVQTQLADPYPKLPLYWGARGRLLQKPTGETSEPGKLTRAPTISLLQLRKEIKFELKSLGLSWIMLNASIC